MARVLRPGALLAACGVSPLAVAGYWLKEDQDYLVTIEFDDGKIMFGKHTSLKEVTWTNILARFGRDRFAEKFEAADLVAFVNWTMLPHMSDIWEALQKELCPGLRTPRRLIFFDLVDAKYEYQKEEMRLPNGKVEKPGSQNGTFMLGNRDYGDGEVDLRGILRILKEQFATRLFDVEVARRGDEVACPALGVRVRTASAGACRHAERRP